MKFHPIKLKLLFLLVLIKIVFTDNLLTISLFPEGSMPFKLVSDPNNQDIIYVIGKTTAPIDGSTIPSSEDMTYGTIAGFISQVSIANNTRIWTKFLFGDDLSYNTEVTDLYISDDSTLYLTGNCKSSDSRVSKIMVFKLDSFTGKEINHRYSYFYDYTVSTFARSSSIQKLENTLYVGGSVLSVNRTEVPLVWVLTADSLSTVNVSVWDTVGSIVALVQSCTQKILAVGRINAALLDATNRKQDVFICYINLTGLPTVVHLYGGENDDDVTSAYYYYARNAIVFTGTTKNVGQNDGYISMFYFDFPNDHSFFSVFGDSMQEDVPSSVVVYGNRIVVSGYTFGYFGNMGTVSILNMEQKAFVAEFNLNGALLNVSIITRSPTLPGLSRINGGIAAVYEVDMGYYLSTFTPPLQLVVNNPLSVYAVTSRATDYIYKPIARENPMNRIENGWRGAFGVSLSVGWIILTVFAALIITVAFLSFCVYACCNMRDAIPNLKDKEPLIKSNNEMEDRKDNEKAADSIELS